MKKSKLSRENYLIQATDIMRKSLFEPKGYKVPKVELSISWSTRGNNHKNTGNAKVLGLCFPKEMHAGGINQITITPNLDGSTIAGSIKILGVLVHELVHAVDNCVSGHGKAFRQCATAVGLTGKMTATTESEELKKYLTESIINKLGIFPHEKVTLSGKTQTTRNIKVECNCCEFSFRTSRKNLELMDEVSHCLACDDGFLQVA